MLSIVTYAWTNDGGLATMSPCSGSTAFDGQRGAAAVTASAGPRTGRSRARARGRGGGGDGVRRPRGGAAGAGAPGQRHQPVGGARGAAGAGGAARVVVRRGVGAGGRADR